MRRIVLCLVVLLFSIPVGVSLSGCGKGSSIVYCQGSSGPRIGEIATITLEPRYYGKSLAYGQTDSMSTPTAYDCKGSPVTSTFKYGSTNQSIVDINPTTGQICAGQWNRNSPNGVADYTYCTANNVTGTANIIATSNGATSNRVTVYVHPAVVSMTLGNPATLTGTCGTDPSTDCCPIPGSTAITASPYVGNSCISQGDSALIVARAFDANGVNITCSIGHPTFTASTGGLINIDENGQATALQPGSTIVTANVARNPSTAGLFSVCPPKTITLSSVNATGNTVTINPNTTEVMTTTAYDTNVDATHPNGHQLTGLSLTYASTTPTTVSATSTGILATFPSVAAITAYCEPPTCNPAPTNYLGLLPNGSQVGNGKPVVSNSLIATANGLSGTRLWIASTKSQYLVPVDFVIGGVGAPVLLPWVPNSMVITQDGSSIYMGSDTALMTISTSSNSVTKQDTTVQGPVLAASPDNSSVVLTDKVRKITYLYNPSTSTSIVSFNGVAKSASYAPDSNTVYITTAPDATSAPNQLIVYNKVNGTITYDMSSTGARDVAVTVPHEGAYIAGDSAIIGRSFCPNTTIKPVDYYPVADTEAAAADHIIATNDGKHMLSVDLPTTGGAPLLNDLVVTLPIGACPASGTGATFTSVVNPVTVTGVTANSVSGIVPSSDSKIAFITYLPTTSATGTGTILPGYKPAASGPGTLTPVTLVQSSSSTTGGPTAPVTGVFSTDNSSFYVGTSGDNLVHIITVNSLTDTQQIAPKLPAVSGSGYATPDLIVQRPRATT